jgi:SAM-dependent methyltransferase
VIARHFRAPGLVADLGCGTARALVPLCRRGFRGLAIDLSDNMLAVVREKAVRENLPIDCLRANLVELDLPEHSIDYAICLFSTLGMIQGRANRQRVLEATRRMLKPGGVFVLHVHNYWWNLYDPRGPWRLATNYLRAKTVGDVEPGDRYFHYRGVHNMFLHVFTRRELVQSLRRAGFHIREIIPLDARRKRQLHLPRLFSSLRASGWIVVSES